MKSLGTILRTCTPEQLRAIAELWGVPPLEGDDPNEILRLERGMRDAIATRTAWEALDAAERAVLLAIVGPAARNWCVTERLETRTGLDLTQITDALAHLSERFIVSHEIVKMQGDELVGQRTAFYGYASTRSAQTPVVEREIVYVPTELATTFYATGREISGALPDRTTLSLDDLLAPYRQGDLDQIGRRFGLTLHTYCSRNEVRAVIADNVSQADAVRYAITQIEEPLRDVYEWLLARGGRATIDELRRRMGWNAPTLLQSLRTFEEYAIAFDAFSDGQRVLFVPAKTFDNLRRAHTRPQVETGLRERAAPQSCRPADSIILWDVAALVAAVMQHDIELTRAQALPKRAAQRLIPMLSNEWARQSDESGYRYLAQVLAEALDLGIVQTANVEDHLRLELGAKLDVWSSQDARMQTHRIIRRWSHNRNWHDRVGAHYSGWMSSYISVSTAREALLQSLRQCAPGVWYDVPSLLRTVRGDDPFVLRPNQRFTGHGGFKVADEVRAHWDDTDGELLSGILSSTLHELGILSLGYDVDTLPTTYESLNPDAIMLTELGAEVLKGDLGLAHVPTERALILQPNFEVLLLEPHMPALYTLIRFAQPEQLGRASRFKLTRETLLRAMNEGMPLEEMLTFLTRHSQKDLPQNVLYTLDDWSRQYKGTRLSQVVLIEVDDESLATELCDSVKLRELGLRRVGPLAVAAPEGSAVRAVRRAIERAGYATQVPEPPTRAPVVARNVH